MGSEQWKMQEWLSLIHISRFGYQLPVITPSELSAIIEYRIIPVSYTHLDVYKRQTGYCVIRDG